MIDTCLLSHVSDQLDDGSEVRWTVEVDVLQRALVGCCDSLESITFWVEDVAVKSEAVRCSVDGWRDGRSVAEDWDLLLGVIILQDVSSGFDGCEVLVPLHIKVVERISLGWITIAECEINGDIELNFASSENIFKEGVSLVEYAFGEGDGLLLALVQGKLALLLSLKLGQVAADVAEVRVLARLLGLEEFYSYLSLRIFICQLRCQY